MGFASGYDQSMGKQQSQPVRLVRSSETIAKCPNNKDRDPACGIENYKSGIDSVCGIENYNKNRGAECGVELYKNQPNPACGVALYKSTTSSTCGLERYKSKAGSACGVNRYKSCAHNTCGTHIEWQSIWTWKRYPDTCRTVIRITFN